MAFAAGHNAEFKVDDSGASLRDLSPYIRSMEFPLEVEFLDTTAFGKTVHTGIAGLQNGTISIEGDYDKTATTGPDDILAGIVVAHPASLSYEYYPAGNNSGEGKYTGECILTGYTTNATVDGKVEFSASFQVTDTITWASV